VTKEELLRTADHLVLVLPYSPASHHAIGAAEIALMKPTANLVNIARGGIVDDAALASALRERRIAAAGLDVFEGEPKVHPDLLTVPNVVLTPHIASATVPTRLAMADLAADNLIGFLVDGKPLTPLNPPRCWADKHGAMAARRAGDRQPGGPDHAGPRSSCCCCASRASRDWTVRNAAGRQ
jgi:gluconate 2-dehydrogenase